MHGLIIRALQCFLRDTYGASVWARILRSAQVPFDGFEPMLTYDLALWTRVLDAAAQTLDRPREVLLEDMGHYLVFHPNLERLRRLLRFGGVSYADFVNSLEEAPGRARLAVPDLNLPDLMLVEVAAQEFRLHCRFAVPGAGHVLLGLMRAMADDYGTLVLLDHEGAEAGAEVLSIHLLDSAHTEGRRFDLAVPAA